MTLNPVDTFTDHGNYKGDPAKVAFVKLNENDAYLEQLAKAALPKVGGILSGPLTTESTITATGRALIAEGSVGAVPTAGKYLLQSVTSDGAFITSYNYSLPNVAPLTIEASYINTAARVATSALAVPHNSAGTEILWNGLAAENGYGCSEYLNFRGGGTGGHLFYACVANVSQRRTARIREGGSIDCYPVQPNPGGSVGTFGFHTQGSFGGGYAMTDGGKQGGWWMASGDLNWGVTQTGTSMGTRMRLSEDGVLSATAFNPTSSADVKDYLEGYAGDADSDLDRMVVITYRYRPEFCESDKTFVGLLAENVHDVRPEATSGGRNGVINVPSVSPEDGSILVDSDGNTIFDTHDDVVPMSIDMMQILALNVRAHQQKSRRLQEQERRIVALEVALDRLVEAIEGKP
ncbi:hypothetical protein ROV86_04525 [Stenotrophomonas pavanii]|uniref:hypothetical protein n=1 Tax=Stenotrophomonas pavanii TaxID=487698 RepID=UPI0028956593|nr:hypothetical protein [Stenotrophomonas pavanii]MDT3527382.1 hypothetical protein [Stenotrophomonas pavanii]